MVAPRLSLLLAAALAVAAWTGTAGGAPSAPPAGEPAPRRVESGAFERWLPLLREGVDVTFSGRDAAAAGESAGPTTPIAALRTLGPLAGDDLAACIRTMEGIAQTRFEELHALPVPDEPGFGYDLLTQARLLCAAEEHLAAAEALRQGDYFVTAPGALPPAPPDAGIVQSLTRRGGERVLVSIVLPFAKHRRFADAYAYKRELWLNYPAHAVARWNGQDEAWRRAAAARAVRAAAPDASADDREWLRRHAPGGTVVDPVTALLSLR